MLDHARPHEEHIRDAVFRPEDNSGDIGRGFHLGLPRDLDEEDRLLFCARRLETGTLRLSADIRTDRTGNLRIAALDGPGHRCEVSIPVRRAEIFHAGLGRHLEEAIAAMTAAGEPVARREIFVSVVLDGLRAQRRWRDNHGKWRIMPQLLAARWSYEVVEAGCERIVSEGRLPLE